MKQYLKEQAKIQQLEKAAEQMHLWAFMGNDALHKRAFSMEKRIQRMRTVSKPTGPRRWTAASPAGSSGAEVLQLKGISKAFGSRTLFSDVYLRVEGGERIAFLGENGAGKTTLLNMITGGEPVDSGIIRMGPAIRAAYLPQIIHFEHPERSLLDTMLYEKEGHDAPRPPATAWRPISSRGGRVQKRVGPLRRRAQPPAAVHAHGRGDQLPDPGRAHQPPGYRLPRVDRGGGGGLRRHPAVRVP